MQTEMPQHQRTSVGHKQQDSRSNKEIKRMIILIESASRYLHEIGLLRLVLSLTLYTSMSCSASSLEGSVPKLLYRHCIIMLSSRCLSAYEVCASRLWPDPAQRLTSYISNIHIYTNTPMPSPAQWIVFLVTKMKIKKKQ